VQITETVPPEELFREYLYFSSFSDFMVDHARALARSLVASRKLGAESLVVEIASNDGYLLQHFVEAGVPVLGIEPARNVAQFAREKRGIPTISEFFGKELAERLKAEGRRPDVIIAANVLAHVPDPNGFIEGSRILLKDDGIAVFEVPYVRDLIERTEFDTVYHEHFSYFSLCALEKLFARHSMVVSDAERIPVHGGSLRLRVSKAVGGGMSDRVRSLLEEERNAGIDRSRFYVEFGDKVRRLRQDLLALVESLKAQGSRIAAYGAAAKGTVLLNYCGIGRSVLDFVVDRNPGKQGRFVPGVRVPIFPPEHLLQEMPDYTLLLPWNIADEILEQQREYRRRGGRFIVVAPAPRVVG
jgi:SAM-dependent methyltransferase